MGRPPAADLTERELEVMHAFWSAGRGDGCRRPATGWRRPGWTGPTRRSPTWSGPCMKKDSSPDQRRAAVRLRGRPILRGRLRTSAGRPGPARLPRFAIAVALPARRAAPALERGAGRPPPDPRGGGPMNDLGWTLGWLAVQVVALLIPAVGLHALATRRGPGLGGVGGDDDPGDGRDPRRAGIPARPRGDRRTTRLAGARLRRPPDLRSLSPPRARGLRSGRPGDRSRAGVRGLPHGLGSVRAAGGRAGRRGSDRGAGSLAWVFLAGLGLRPAPAPGRPLGGRALPEARGRSTTRACSGWSTSFAARWDAALRSRSARCPT